jgi:glycosyltransferase involved in cell wall biosynthesis
MLVSVFSNVNNKDDLFLSKFAADNLRYDLFASKAKLGLMPLPLKTVFSEAQILSSLPYLKSYDAVLSMDTLHGTIFATAQSIYGCKNISHVMIDSSSFPVLAAKLPLTGILKTIFSSVKKIVCFTRDQAQFWNALYKSADKALFIPFGVNYSYYRPLGAEISDYIFSAGRTARDIQTLLRVAKNSTERFVIVVSNRYQSEVSSFNLPKNVKVYFEISEHKYKQLLEKSKMVVLTLKDVPYSCGLSVLLHSMLMGKPVVLTKVPATMDYVSDWETGVFVKPYDEVDLAQKISYLLQNPNIAAQIAENSQKIALKEYTEAALTKKLANILKQLK